MNINDLLLYLSLIYLTYVIMNPCSKEKFTGSNNKIISENVSYLDNKVIAEQSKEPLHKKEEFGPGCPRIFGKYNPRCVTNENLNHIGYYSNNNTKYPVLDLIEDKKKSRYLMKGDDILPFEKKFWNKVTYFSKPFKFQKNIPYNFVYNFRFVGKIENVHIDKCYFIYEKKLNSNLYKYILFEKDEDNYKISFELPNRKQINNGDTIFIRSNSSTFGPFQYIED